MSNRRLEKLHIEERGYLNDLTRYEEELVNPKLSLSDIRYLKKDIERTHRRLAEIQKLKEKVIAELGHGRLELMVFILAFWVFFVFIFANVLKADETKIILGNDFLVPGGQDRFLSNYFTISHQINNETWSFKNEMFTPNNLKGSPVPTNDHPWDGSSLFGYEERYGVRDGETRRFKLQTGLVGRGSGSAELQRFVHAQGFGARPTYQPTNPTEFVLNFGYRHDEVTLLHTFFGLSESTTTYGVDIGNYITQAVIKQELRKGFDSFYAVAGIEGRAVAYSTVLDGRLFQDNEYTVEREPMVAEFTAGIGSRFNDVLLELVYRYVTEQYETQDGRHAVAELTIGYKF